MGDDDQSDQLNAQLDAQQQQADAEGQRRLMHLQRMRMDIVKSTGMPKWVAPPSSNNEDI